MTYDLFSVLIQLVSALSTIKLAEEASSQLKEKCEVNITLFSAKSKIPKYFCRKKVLFLPVENCITIIKRKYFKSLKNVYSIYLTCRIKSILSCSNSWLSSHVWRKLFRISEYIYKLTNQQTIDTLKMKRITQ